MGTHTDGWVLHLCRATIISFWIWVPVVEILATPSVYMPNNALHCILFSAKFASQEWGIWEVKRRDVWIHRWPLQELHLQVTDYSPWSICDSHRWKIRELLVRGCQSNTKERTAEWGEKTPSTSNAAKHYITTIVGWKQGAALCGREANATISYFLQGAKLYSNCLEECFCRSQDCEARQKEHARDIKDLLCTATKFAILSPNYEEGWDINHNKYVVIVDSIPEFDQVGLYCRQFCMLRFILSAGDLYLFI